MNIILTSVHISNTPDAIPLAPALLKSYVDKFDSKSLFNIEILESKIDDDLNKFADKILKMNPDIVGFSIYVWNRSYYLKLAKLLRTKIKNVIIIAGGAEIRSGYKELLENEINYTMQGEGEEIFLDLLNHLYEDKDPTCIDGINNDVSRFISDLNSIPSPILSGTLDLTKYDGYLWELSRGCPYNCDFCFESRGAKGVRYYSMEKVIQELDFIIEKEVPQVFVLDPTFNKDLKRAKKILNLIKQRKTRTHFHFEIRAELLDKEISELFSDINSSLQIGIQSADENVLKLVNRNIDKPLFKRKINLLNNCGATFGLDLIYGLPGDNYEGFKRSMEFVISLQPNHLDIFPLSILPGTTLWENSSKLQLNFLDRPPYTILSTPTYTEEDMVKSKKLKESCDYIYNNCRSTGWLTQLCDELKIKTTDFIEQFIYWEFDKNKSSTENIKMYIKNKFSPKYYNLITDVINYHTSYSDAVLSKKSVTSIKKHLLLKSIPVLSQTATLGIFNYPILDAFDDGVFLIQDIKKIFKPNKSKYISWYHVGGDVVFESFSNEIMSFLSKIDGKLNCHDLSKDIDVDFLIFAQESGLLLFI